jgi:hypothetical protein
MNLTAFDNSKYTNEIVYKKYIDLLSNMGDKINNSYKFGINNKIDKIQFLKIKNLLPYIKDVISESAEICVKQNNSITLNDYYNAIG